MALPTALLAVPAPGDRTLGGIVRKVRLLAARLLLTRAGGPGLQRVQRVVADALRAHPNEALAAIGSVDVLAPLLAVEGTGTGDADDAIPPLLAGLVARRALPEAVVWEAPVRRLLDPARGRAWVFDPPARALLARPSGLEVELADRRKVAVDDLPAIAPYLALDGDVHLALIDSNPLADYEDHPDKRGNAVDLGGRDPAVWVAALRDALGLIRAGLPTWADELPLPVQRLVPVGFEPERHLSASYREVPGLAYLSLHPDPLTLAEAIVHEAQHSKLNLLSWLDPVLHNGRTFWTPSPVRPDLRPLMGVLLAVHAFVPVAALHHGLAAADHPIARTGRFAERRAQVLAGNARGLAIVQANADASPTGRRVIEELAALHTVLVADGPRGPVDLDVLPH